MAASKKLKMGPTIDIFNSSNGFSGSSMFANPPKGNNIILGTGIPDNFADIEWHNSWANTTENIIKKNIMSEIPNKTSRIRTKNKNVI